MDLLNAALNRVFTWLLSPFGGLHPLWGLAVVSVLTGVAMLWVFGKVSNQRRIRAIKTRIKAHLLEMWIFRENVRVVAAAQARTLWNTLKYAAFSAQALVVIIIPVVLIMAQMQARYGYRPLAVGEPAVVNVQMPPGTPLDAMALKVETSDGLAVETPPLRDPQSGEVSFRMRASAPGRHTLTVVADGEHIEKSVVVAETGVPISAVRGGGWFERLLNPVEANVPPGAIRAIAVRYPTRRLALWGLEFHWLWAFFIVSLAAGFALKRALRVEV